MQRKLLAALSATVLAAGAALAAAQEPPAGHHHDHAPATTVDASAWPRPPAGSRWSADAPLREGMARLHASVDALEGMAAGGRHRADAVRAEAAAIDEAVAYLFANCRLDPEPDAALHHLLAAVLEASARLRADPGGPAAVADLREALSHYPHLFAD